MPLSLSLRLCAFAPLRLCAFAFHNKNLCLFTPLRSLRYWTHAPILFICDPAHTPAVLLPVCLHQRGTLMQHPQTCSNTGAPVATADQAKAKHSSLPDIDAISVAELMERWPAVVPVFVTHRMACVGCIMSSFDRLDDVCRIYRMQAAELTREILRAIEGQP
jgi:hybrid cluster-associated redox disulfide protein